MNVPSRLARFIFITMFWAAGAMLLVAPQAFSQEDQEEEEGEAAPTISANTGKILNEAIELLNMENYAGAREVLAEIRMDRLSPYERSRVEQILANIDYSQENYPSARTHLEAAITAGGLNQQEISQARYQIAQLFIVEENWAEGAAALEEWFQTATNPNSAAYYLLAIAYYQQDDFERALAPARQAVELTDEPQESWLQLLLALYMQRDEYRQAIPLLQRLVEIAPGKKNYWVQLSSIYAQLEDYPRALAALQLPHSAGLLTEDSEIRRLADLLVFNDIPYRGARVLEDALEKDMVTKDADLYEKLANCWIAARAYDRAVGPLELAAELSPDGNLFVRLGEVQVQREDWAAAEQALERGLDKGDLDDTADAQLLMGIALFNQDKRQEARPWFERAASSEAVRDTARGYIQLIDTHAG